MHEVLVWVIGGIATVVVVLSGVLWHFRWHFRRRPAPSDILAVTSAAGAIDAASRGLKIMLDAVPGSADIPEHEVAAIVESVATAMLGVLNTLPSRVLACEEANAAMSVDLQELRQQVLGLSKRPTV